MVSAARKAIESLYTGVCTVYEYQGVTDELTKLTKKQEVSVLEEQPCRLSYKQLNNAEQTTTGATITQTIKLFILPDINIKPGSKISVTQNGETAKYKNSGVPAVYRTHQEIILELFDRWS